MTAPTEPASSREHALPLRGAALLLDMDGTLIDLGPAVERSWNRLFSELGVDLEVGAPQHGKPAPQVLGEGLPGLGDQEPAAARRRVEALGISDVDGNVVLLGSE